MRSIIHQPGPPLDRHIAAIWYWEGAPTTHRLERVLPNGSQGLVINLHADRIRAYDPRNPRQFETLSGAVITGARACFEVIDSDCQQRIVGVNFRPGGAYPFLGLPADALYEREVNLDAVWGGAQRYLREQLLEAGSPVAIIRLLEAHLRARLRTDIHPSVAYAIGALARGGAVATVARATGYSLPYFSRRFRQEVGIVPKMFARIRRFQTVLDRLVGQRDVDWAATALACGYYDQAHFIHNFRHFSGCTPAAFLTLRGEHRNHLPLPD